MDEQKQRLLAVRCRLAQHYLDKLRMAQRIYQQGNENEAEALSMFDEDSEQVRQLLAWAATNDSQAEEVTALCSAFAKASPDIFWLRLPPSEYLTWLEAALTAARRLGDKRAEVLHLLEICRMSDIIVEYHAAYDYAQQALALARQLDDRLLVAHGLMMCGTVSRNAGNLEEAQSCYEQSLALYQRIGDRRNIASALLSLGTVAITRRNNVAAQDYLERCLALYQEIGDQERINPCLNNLGLLATWRGNYTLAREYLEQALTMNRLIENTSGRAVILTNLGVVAYYQAEYARAQNYLEQGLTIARSLHSLAREAICLSRSGQVMMAQGDLLKARDYFEESIALCHTLPKGTLLSETLGNLAVAYMLLQQADRAYAALCEALEITSSHSASHLKLLSLIAAARVWILRGRSLEAATWLGLVENDPHPAVKMADLKRDLQVARAECEAAISPEQYASAWEAGKTLDVETVTAEILGELQSS